MTPSYRPITTYLPILLIGVSLATMGCDSSGSDDKEWRLVWADEFDGAAGALPDPEKWTFDIGTDWGNAQLEYDTDFPRNVSTDGEGNLRITAIQESYEGQPYTSARIVTRDLFEPTYGRIEARIKMPSGRGLWPAFWMLGANIDEVGWPQCGEIDIMEYRGQEPTVVHGSLHGPGYSGGNPITKAFRLPGDRFDTGFHTFRIDWDEDGITWYVNDQPYHRAEPQDTRGNEWVYDHSFYLILNLAVGGGFVGSPDQNTRFPQQLVVDWVRVYEEV